MTASGATPATGQPATTAESDTAEIWRAIYLQGTKIGYSHTTYMPFTEGGEQRVRITDTSETLLERAGQTVSQSVAMESVESPTGELKRFKSEMRMGPTPTITEGIVRDGQLIVTTQTGSGRSDAVLPWPAGTGGFFAVEQSLRQSPLQPGEQRTVAELVPLLNQLSQVQLTAEREETTELLSGASRLLRIAVTTELGPGVTIPWTMWTDPAGEILKAEVPGIGQTIYRTTQETALEAPTAASFDLITDTLVRVARPIPDPYETTRARYKVVTAGANPLELFHTEPGKQTLEGLDEQAALLTVSAGRRGARMGVASADEQNNAALAPSRFIQSDDPRIVQMANSVAPGEQDPWKLALALEKYVHTQITQKDFSQAFATASDVARDLQGDCTEHSVLLAALARARGIPTRVVTGLVYVETAQSFGYHMWNEALIDQQWVGLDATLGRGGTSATHIKLSHTNLDGDSAYHTFLPVLNLIGQLNIEVVEVEHDN